MVEIFDVLDPSLGFIAFCALHNPSRSTELFNIPMMHLGAPIL